MNNRTSDNSYNATSSIRVTLTKLATFMIILEIIVTTNQDVANEGESYVVETHVNEASVRVIAAAEPKATITITLTSPMMREGAG